MREKTAIMVKKVHDLLTEHNYLTTTDIKNALRIKTWKIYQIVRYLRIEGIGIIPTKKGYILSESAQRSDDVHFIRKCFGRRTSDLIALNAAQADIETRWNAVEDKSNISQVFRYLAVNPTNTNKAKEGIKYLLSSVKE